MALLFVLSGLFLVATDYEAMGMVCIVIGICVGMAAPDRDDY